MEHVDEPGGTLLLLLDNSVYSLNEDQAHDQTRLEAMCNTARLVAADAQPQAVGVITLTSSGKPRPHLALPISNQWAGKSGTLTRLSHHTLAPHIACGDKDGGSVSSTLHRILGALKLAGLSMRGAPKTTARQIVLLLCSPASVPRHESHMRRDVEALAQAVQSNLDMGASFKVIAFGDAANDAHADGLQWLEQLCSMESSSLLGPFSPRPSSQSICREQCNGSASSSTPSAAVRMQVGKGPMGHPDPFGLWGDAATGAITPSKHSKNLLVVASPTREQLGGGFTRKSLSPCASSSSEKEHAGEHEKCKGPAREAAPTLSAGDDESAEKTIVESSALVAGVGVPCASGVASASTSAALDASQVLKMQRPVALEKSLADSRLLTTSIESILKQCWDTTYEAQITFPLVEMDEDPKEPTPAPIPSAPTHNAGVAPGGMAPAKLKARLFGSKPPWMEEGYMTGMVQETPLPDVIPLTTKLADALAAPKGSPAASLATSSSSSARQKEPPLALALPPVDGKEAVLVTLETMMNHLDNTQLRSLIEICGTDTEDCKDRAALLRRAVDVIAIQQQAAYKGSCSPPGTHSPATPATCKTRRGSMQKDVSPLIPSVEKCSAGGWSSSKKAEESDPPGPSGRWSQPPPSTRSVNSNSNASPAAGQGGPGAATKSNVPPSRGDTPMLSLSSDCRMESRLTADYHIEQQMSVMIPGSRLSVTLDQVGAVTNALMTPVVQIRVGRLRRNRKQGGFRMLINDSSKGHLALHGLPNGDLQMRWSDEKGMADEEIAHVPMPRPKDEVLFDPVTTEQAEKACSIVRIDEDPSGRSFFVQRQKGVRHYFWIREVSIPQGLELLAQMQAACDNPPSLAQRAGVSEQVVHSLGQMALAFTSQRGPMMPPEGGSTDSNAPRRRRRSAPEEVYGQATRYGTLTGIEPAHSEYTPARSRGTTPKAAEVVAAMQRVRQASLEDDDDDEYGYAAKMREIKRVHKQRTQAREKQKAEELKQGPSSGLHKGFFGKASTSGKHKGAPHVVGQVIDKDPQPPCFATTIDDLGPGEVLVCATVTATVTATATSTATCRRTGREVSATVNATAQAAAQAHAASMEEAQQAAAKEAERLARAEAEKQAWGAAEKASKERMEVFALEEAAIEEDCDSKQRVDSKMEREKLAKELKDLRKKLDRERILDALPGSLPHWQSAPPGKLQQLAQEFQLPDRTETDMRRQRSTVSPSTSPASFLARTAVEHPGLEMKKKEDHDSASAVARLLANNNILEHDKVAVDPEGPSEFYVPATPSDIGSATPDSTRRHHVGTVIATPSPSTGLMPTHQVSAQDAKMAETLGCGELNFTTSKTSPEAQNDSLCVSSSPRMCASMSLQPQDVGTGMSPEPLVRSSKDTSDSSASAAQNLNSSLPTSSAVSGNRSSKYKCHSNPPPGTRADLHSLRELLNFSPTSSPSSLAPEKIASMLKSQETTIWAPVREGSTTAPQQISGDVLDRHFEISKNAAETSRSGKLSTRVKTAADVLARVAEVRDEMEAEVEKSPQPNRIPATPAILVDGVVGAEQISKQDVIGERTRNGDVIDTDAIMEDDVPQKRKVDPKVDVNNLTRLFSAFYRD